MCQQLAKYRHKLWNCWSPWPIIFPHRGKRYKHVQDILLNYRVILQNSVLHVSLLELLVHNEYKAAKWKEERASGLLDHIKWYTELEKPRGQTGKCQVFHKLRVLSSSCFVFSTTAPAHNSTVVASSERQVTAHTRGDKGQGNKGQPPEAELLITAIARTRIWIFSFRIRHAVVEHTVCTPHTADSPDEASYSVWGILTLPSPIFFMIEYFPAVHTPWSLPIFLSPPRFTPDRLSLYNSTLDVMAYAEVWVAYVRIIVIVFGGLGFSKLYIRVPIIWINVLPLYGSVAVVLITRCPDLFPWIDPLNFLFILWEADMPMWLWEWLSENVMVVGEKQIFKD